MPNNLSDTAKLINSVLIEIFTRSHCTQPKSSQCWCMVQKHWQSQRLLLNNRMPLTHGHSKKILRTPYISHVTNASVRDTMGCPPVSFLTKTKRLHFFGHVARSDPRQDHHRAISALTRPPDDWRRPRGHQRTTWLRVTDADVQSGNICIHSAWMKANDRVLWWRIIDTATLH